MLRVAMPLLWPSSRLKCASQLSEIICTSVDNFVSSSASRRVLLVCTADESELAERVARAWRQSAENEQKIEQFSTVVHERRDALVRLKTLCERQVDVIVNPATWRLKPKGGHALNRVVFERAGADYLHRSTALANGGKPARDEQCVCVRLDDDCQLFSEEGVRRIVHVVGTPSDEDVDRSESDALLRAQHLYRNVFESISSSSSSSSSSAAAASSVEDSDRFQVNRQHMELPRWKARKQQSRVVPAGWRHELLRFVWHPENYDASVYVHRDDDVVIMRDGYPKARLHWLVMPTERADFFDSLSRDDLPMLRAMKEAAEAACIEQRVDRSTVRMGFHAVPSCTQLHMHVISQDFDSARLKHKKHWNSFTTKFFVGYERFVEHLERNNRIDFDKHACEALLSADMHCHRCGIALKNMPTLKAHLSSCQA
jgi:aprataxin